MGYRCKYFTLEELIWPELYAERRDAAWDMFDPKVLITLDELRAAYGPIKVNDWAEGGKFKLSGARPADSPIGAKWSMHKLFRAMDCKFLRASPVDVQLDILAHPDRFPFLTCLEDAAKTISWLHFDDRNHNRDEQIWVVEP